MITTDPQDPNLGHGSDDSPVPQNKAYLVLSEEERAKGFVRPYRTSYVHVGLKPEHPLRNLTPEEQETYKGEGYAKYETYPPAMAPLCGRFWTAKELETKGCGTATNMGRALAETYARQPKFYGATYCVHCSMHRPVGEFVWEGTNETVGS